MSEKGDWPEQKVHVLKTLERHEDAIEQQEQINKTQSEFNHDVDKRVTSITEKISWAVAAIATFWALASDFIKEALEKLLK